MKSRMKACIAAIFLFAGPPLQAQESVSPTLDTAEKSGELDTVVVLGGFATPQMWKVSKGDHVMWVVGDTRAPSGIKWRTNPLETRVAESQLVIYPGRLDTDIGFFRTIGLVTLVPSAFKAAKNPDNKTLKDVLPPEVYERWRAIRIVYAPRDNDLERWRPFIALGMLEEKIVKKFESSQPRPGSRPPGPPLRPLVDKAAKQHKVKIHTMHDVERKIEVTNARGMLKSVGGLNLVDAKCIDQKLDYLERRIDYLKQQAAGTAPDKIPRPASECNEADILLKKLRSGEIPDPAGIIKTIDNLEMQDKSGRQQLEAEWIAAAETSLAKNKSTIAVLPLFQLKRPTSPLTKLKELGYTVEDPE